MFLHSSWGKIHEHLHQHRYEEDQWAHCTLNREGECISESFANRHGSATWAYVIIMIKYVCLHILQRNNQVPQENMPNTFIPKGQLGGKCDRVCKHWYESQGLTGQEEHASRNISESTHMLQSPKRTQDNSRKALRPTNKGKTEPSQ